MARDQSKLHPILQYKIKEFIKLCDKQGLEVGIGECYRSVSEQDALYAQGRTTNGAIVTNCKGTTYSSPHQWGIAFDFYRNDGKGAYNTSDKFFERVGAVAKSLGLEWGGDWKTFVDRPHIQLPYWGSSVSKLKTMYKTPDKFISTWNPTKPTKTVTSGSSLNDVLWVQNHICKLSTTNMIIDGKWGNKTQQAVLQYQKMLGWEGSGKAGQKTIAALEKNRIK